jgi:hypothetical protein
MLYIYTGFQSPFASSSTHTLCHLGHWVRELLTQYDGISYQCMNIGCMLKIESSNFVMM